MNTDHNKASLYISVDGNRKISILSDRAGSSSSVSHIGPPQSFTLLSGKQSLITINARDHDLLPPISSSATNYCGSSTTTSAYLTQRRFSYPSKTLRTLYVKPSGSQQAYSLSPTTYNSNSISTDSAVYPDFQTRRTSFSSYSQPSHASDDALCDVGQLDLLDFDPDQMSPFLMPDVDTTNSSSPNKLHENLACHFQGMAFHENAEPAADGETATVVTPRVGRRSKPKEHRCCGVCGDKALSCNFDALSCESCKAFFRRNAAKGMDSFVCSHDNNCHITVTSRKLCKKCRLKKCIEIGMKKEYILSNEERLEKRMKINQNKIVKKLEDRGWIAKDLSITELAEKDLLSEAEISLLDEVVEAYSASLWVKIEEHGCDRRHPSMRDLVNFADVSIRRAIEMFKRLDCFRSLDKKQQICLLKSGCIELLILRGILAFDPDKQHFLDSRDNETLDSMKLQDFLTSSGMEVSNAFTRLLHTLVERMHCRRETLLLLLLICLFSDRNVISKIDQSCLNRTFIEQLQMQYVDLLKHFLMTVTSIKTAERIFPQIMLSLMELRSVNEHLLRHLGEAELTSVTPLMVEILNLHSTALSVEDPNCPACATTHGLIDKSSPEEMLAQEDDEELQERDKFDDNLPLSLASDALELFDYTCGTELPSDFGINMDFVDDLLLEDNV